MSKLRKRKNLNREIQRMEVKEAKENKPLLTEKVRAELNKPYKPGIRSALKKMKKRKQKP